MLRPVYSDTTQLDSTRRRVELSCVAINGPLDWRFHRAPSHVYATSSIIKDDDVQRGGLFILHISHEAAT